MAPAAAPSQAVEIVRFGNISTQGRSAIEQQMEPSLRQNNLQPQYFVNIVAGVTDKPKQEEEALTALIDAFGLKHEGDVLVEESVVKQATPVKKNLWNLQIRYLQNLLLQ